MGSPFLKKFQEGKYPVSQIHLETSSVASRFIHVSLFLAVKNKWESQRLHPSHGPRGTHLP